MKRLFFAFAFLIPFTIHAQTIKTGVLVLGNGDAAFAAGVQASESGVNTTVITQSDGFKLSDFNARKKNGVIIAFEKRARKELKLADSIPLPTINNQIANAVIKKWSDSSKLFKVINNAPYYELRRSGKGWEIKLSKEKTIKAKVLILADKPDQLLKNLKITSLNMAETNDFNYSTTFYRTSIAGLSSKNSFLSLYNLLIPDQENLLYIKQEGLEIGQATGATGAYAVFYNSKTSLSNLKQIQGELLSYKCALMPFDDVEVTDSNWLAIQKIGATGFIKAEIKDGKAYFKPEQEVTFDEIKQPIKDYSFKAQIWFDDHQNVPINLENTISLVCYVSNKSEDATKNELQKKWNKTYKFKSKYDLKKILSRREFSVIVNDYSKPFDYVNVDKTGRVIR